MPLVNKKGLLKLGSRKLYLWPGRVGALSCYDLLSLCVCVCVCVGVCVYTCVCVLLLCY